MTRNSVSERILFLRRRIAALEARGGAAGGADAAGKGADAFAVLPPQDSPELLLQNLAGGGLGEILPAHPRDCGAAAGFACALALRSCSARPRAGAVWISEDMAAHEIGLPYGRGLEALGLDLSRLVFVRTRGPSETLWAMEEALKACAAAVVAESWIAPRAYDLSASRRLLLAARRGGGCGLLLLLRPCFEAGRLSSAAQLRFEIAARPPPSLPASAWPGASSLETPGPLGWRLRVAKARAGLFGAFDPLAWREISFDPEKAVFRHAFPERVPAEAADRPDFAPARRRG
jgi:protein ImuA